jgi:hypothetical protein
MQARIADRLADMRDLGLDDDEQGLKAWYGPQYVPPGYTESLEGANQPSSVWTGDVGSGPGARPTQRGSQHEPDHNTT